MWYFCLYSYRSRKLSGISETLVVKNKLPPCSGSAPLRYFFWSIKRDLKVKVYITCFENPSAYCVRIMYLDLCSNPLLPGAPFFHALKTENRHFSDDFQGYKKETTDSNGSMYSLFNTKKNSIIGCSGDLHCVKTWS